MELKECEVCGDAGEVSRHYGIACCYGCKAFFRRTVFEKKIYKCKDGENCKVEKANRNKCRYCRYQKCLKAGMSEESIREPYCVSDRKSRTPTPSLPTLRNLSPTSETLITFLKSMTRSVIDNYDPRFEGLSLEECLKLPINSNLTLSEALKNPHLVMPKVKFDISKLKWSDCTFAWYQGFVCVAEWAKGIPQFRMLQVEDQERLFHQNFAILTVPMIFLYPHYSENFMECIDDIFPDCATFTSGILSKMSKRVSEAYKLYIIEPFKTAKVDEEELVLLTSIMLFQFSESLSNEGHQICKAYKEKLYTALYEYQLVKFPDKSELERVLRYTRLMELMHTVTKVWGDESEFHLMLSTFNEMNIDGLLKELLFNKSKHC